VSRTRAALSFACLLLVPDSLAARGHHHQRGDTSVRAAGFDYYVLSLSWSPQHCAEVSRPSDDSQCGRGRRYGFVVHGLWPQYEDGSYPERCSTTERLPRSVVADALEMMPSADLVRHEWWTHGACSGMSAAAYFERVQQAFRRIHVPDRYDEPERAFRVTAQDVREAFVAVNRTLPDGAIAVRCAGHFLAEVRICLSSDLAPRRCGPGVRDACRGEVTVRPLR